MDFLLSNALFLFQDPIQGYFILSHHVSLNTHWLGQFFRHYFWFGWLWQLWRVLVRYFVQCPSIKICLICFFIIWLGFCRGKMTEVNSHNPHIVSTVHTVNMTCHADVNFDHLAEVMFVMLLHSDRSFPRFSSCPL